MSSDTPTVTTTRFDAHDSRDTMAWAPSATTRVPASTTASTLRPTTVPRRLRPRRLGAAAVARPAFTASLNHVTRGPLGLPGRLYRTMNDISARLPAFPAIPARSPARSPAVPSGDPAAAWEKVIRRAIAAGYPVRSILVTEDKLAGLAGLASGCAAPVYVLPAAVARQLTGYQVHRGALASMARRPLPSVAEVIAGAKRLVVLEDLVDHGNVGAIFRCAAALGVGAVILSPRCADPLYRRAVKVSMGAVFAIRYARMAHWHDGLAALRAAGFQLLALTPDQSAVPLDDAGLGQRVALLLGSEGDGLSSRWMHEADQAVCIPMSSAAMALGVDSLNVVAAAAIACHGLMRHRPDEAPRGRDNARPAR